MNERILLLAEQAGFIDRGNGHTAYMNFDHEKFAELIVKECADVLSRVPGGYDSSLFYKNITKLKKHFGVE